MDCNPVRPVRFKTKKICVSRRLAQEHVGPEETADEAWDLCFFDRPQGADGVQPGVADGHRPAAAHLFLLTSSFVTQNGLRVTLPDVAAAAPLEQLYVAVTIDDREATIDGLAAVASAASALDMRVSIATEAATPTK